MLKIIIKEVIFTLHAAADQEAFPAQFPCEPHRSPRNCPPHELQQPLSAAGHRKGAELTCHSLWSWRGTSLSSWWATPQPRCRSRRSVSGTWLHCLGKAQQGLSDTNSAVPSAAGDSCPTTASLAAPRHSSLQQGTWLGQGNTLCTGHYKISTAPLRGVSAL